MRTKSLYLLIPLGVIILAIVFLASRARTPLPPNHVFTEAQIEVVKKELETYFEGDVPILEEEQYRQKIKEKYYNSAPELMALFPLIEGDHEKNSLLDVIYYKKEGRTDILKFLEKNLNDVTILRGELWVTNALGYLGRNDLSSALRVAPRLLMLKYEGSNSTDGARITAIGIMERHGGEKALEPLAQFMAQQKKAFGDQDLLYQHAEGAVNEIKTRLGKENPKPHQ